MNLAELSIRDFIEVLASAKPTPGGGSVGALCGALGAALSAMVAGLTEGKEKFRDSWQDMEKIRCAAIELAKDFLMLFQADSEAYDSVLSALRLPKDTDENKSLRKAAILDATRNASLVPLKTLRASEELMLLAKDVLSRGTPAALTDAAAALQLARSAAAVASYNVRVNLSALGDNAETFEFQREVQEVIERMDKVFEETDAFINSRLI